MSVYLGSGGSISMAQSVRYRRNRHMLRDQERGIGMAKAMDADLRQVIPCHEVVKPSGQSVRMHRLAVPCGE